MTRLAQALGEAVRALKQAQVAADVGDVYLVEKHLKDTEDWIRIARKVTLNRRG